MMEQYFDLLGACAQGGAQAFGDAVLWAQLYLTLFSVMLVALIVACCALLWSPTSVEQAEVAMRAQLWERISAACWVDRIHAYTRRDLRQLCAPEWLEGSDR